MVAEVQAFATGGFAGPSPLPGAADGTSIDLYCCPTCREALRQEGDRLVCAAHGTVGRIAAPVVSFLSSADPFYEGKYNNRTRYVPTNDGLLATLPIRVVHQGYSTTVAARVMPGAKVVEIGCAGGIAWFGQRYEMIGIDLSATGLRLAAEHYAHVVQCDASRMPLPDASVDAVISSFLFEHLTVDQKRTLLSETHRVLRPGGSIVFFFDVATDNAVISRFRRADPERYQALFLDGDGHLGYETVDANLEHFTTAGFRIVREDYHETTPVLGNSVWQKLAQWPGISGRIAKLAAAMTNGPGRLPYLVGLAAIDSTVGRLMPRRHARCMTIVAEKP